MKKVFITFSSSDWAGTRTRLKYQAIESGWFDEVYSLSEKDIPEIEEKYSERWNLPFHGFFFWKPLAIMQIYNKLKEGDVLVYNDAGNTINLSGWRQFNEKLELLKTNPMMAYGMTSIRAFTDESVYKAFGIENPSEELLNWPQVQASLLYIRKCQESTKILLQWKKMCIEHPEILVYEFEESKKKQVDGFVQNRGDQSVLGIIQWLNKDKFSLISPNIDYICNQATYTGRSIRALDGDIFATRRKFNYKPYVSFVIGHCLPFFEKDYDEYTHFLNVGNKELHRCTDKTGDNIHDLDGLAEFTGIYWIYKNIDLSDVKYISISTYRKPFFVSNNQAWDLLESKQANAIAMKYFQNRFLLHQNTFDEKTLNHFYDVFKKYHPDDLEDFKNHQKQGYFYPCNSFIMSVENFKKYCEYVLPFMVEFGKETNGQMGTAVSKYSEHCPPAGVFGEDITSFFLEKYVKNIYSSPLVIYPKESTMFSGMLQQTGMFFGTGTFANKEGNSVELFFPQGVHQEYAPIVKQNTFVSSDKFYPDGISPEQLQFIIKSPTFRVEPGFEDKFKYSE